MASQPAAHAAGLRVLRTTRVAPAPPAGEPSLPERALPLIFMDAGWLHAQPVERVFFYRLGPCDDDDVDAVLSRMEESLPRAIHAFYPLAGRVRPTPGETNRYELLYQPGDGVAFTVAEHDGVGVGVDELATDEPRELAKIASFVPELPEGGAVLALQVTVLPPNRRGLAVGIIVHHSACDGVGSTHFLHTWAAACAGDRMLPEPPVIDRTLIRDLPNMHDEITSSTNEAKDLFKAPDAGKLLDVLATFTLSKELLQGVKDAVASEAARRGVPPPRCTSHVAMYGLMWHCYRRARRDDGGRAAAAAHFIFAVDHRSRLVPRVPDNYLGNCVGPGFASAPEEELAVADAAGGVFTACATVAAAIDEAVRGELAYWEGWTERVVEACRDDAPFSVAGSTRFRVYDVDFGFGRPAKVEIVSVAKTGAVSVAEDRSGAGGIEVGIALPPERMDRFRRCLADAIAWLSSSSQCNYRGKTALILLLNRSDNFEWHFI
uniref:Quercetin 3-O-glucoside-6''-O-malonyltransferase n=1 Tax=Oryza sativa subsp. japonica TaxID=39947 RepID=Q6K6T6_ORYSJ|nr:putative quercetin 3-O-glucoside-6''-O-malonyltransferase [Oryza sativa Japonica Group]BAD21960.1 putative quercetin 3-O-glucoside-6''-O-malonyltransferase [Oryza sativa Japonica Group]